MDTELMEEDTEHSNDQRKGRVIWFCTCTSRSNEYKEGKILNIEVGKFKYKTEWINYVYENVRIN